VKSLAPRGFLVVRQSKGAMTSPNAQPTKRAKLTKPAKRADRFHLTTAIPYVNARPHIGHVLEWFQADVINRYQRLLGKRVMFTSGADENSLKNVQAAEKAGVPVSDWLDKYAQIFQDAYQRLGIELDEFRRGSDQTKHWPGVQQLWRATDQAGDLYKKTYTGLYCVGCECFYKPEELVDGRCPQHQESPQQVSEENYFFRLSKYQRQLRLLIETDQLKIVSEKFKKEVLSFIDQGLEDFSVSRRAGRARGVGVPVPGDDSQVMYVWFDALTIYMTALGWGYDHQRWLRFWPADVHFIGKDILRFHAVYWPAILLSAGLPLPKAISVHGFLTADGRKMSKSLGNVVDPFQLIERYGLEPVRYYLLRYIPSHGDGDFSYDSFERLYTAELANGLGNLCSRVAALCHRAGLAGGDGQAGADQLPAFSPQVAARLDELELGEALEIINQRVAAADQFLSDTAPWTKRVEAQAEVLRAAVQQIVQIATNLRPFLPQTSRAILEHFRQQRVAALAPLFPRLEQS